MSRVTHQWSKDRGIEPITSADSVKPLPEYEVPEAIHGGHVTDVAQKAGLADDPTLAHVAERMNQWRDGFQKVAKVRANPSVQHTQAANLQALGRHADAALTTVSRDYDRLKLKLSMRAAELDVAETEALGLMDRGNGVEIRKALRELDDEGRDKALNQAITEKDGEVLQALLSGSPITAGTTAHHQSIWRKRALAAHAPQLDAHRDALASAREARDAALTASYASLNTLKAQKVVESYAGQDAAAQAALAALSSPQ